MVVNETEINNLNQEFWTAITCTNHATFGAHEENLNKDSATVSAAEMQSKLAGRVDTTSTLLSPLSVKFHKHIAVYKNSYWNWFLFQAYIIAFV